MTKDEVQSLKPGIYTLHWIDGGYSVAMIGVTSDGGRWMAPINWVEPSTDQATWQRVIRAVRHVGPREPMSRAGSESTAASAEQ